jgi:hypothetical protein
MPASQYERPVGTLPDYRRMAGDSVVSAKGGVGPPGPARPLLVRNETAAGLGVINARCADVPRASCAVPTAWLPLTAPTLVTSAGTPPPPGVGYRPYGVVERSGVRKTGSQADKLPSLPSDSGSVGPTFFIPRRQPVSPAPS